MVSDIFFTTKLGLNTSSNNINNPNRTKGLVSILTKSTND